MINKEKSLMSWKMRKSLSWPNCRKMDSKICPLYMGKLSFKKMWAPKFEFGDYCYGRYYSCFADSAA